MKLNEVAIVSGVSRAGSRDANPDWGSSAEWNKMELAAWKERFPKSDLKTLADFRREYPQYKYRRQDDVIALK